jgi:hypothetical protein
MQYAYYVELAENDRVYMGPSRDLEARDQSPNPQGMVGVLGAFYRRQRWQAQSERHDERPAYDEEGGAYLEGVVAGADCSLYSARYRRHNRG